MDAAHHVVVGDAGFRADPRVIFDGPALELLAGPVDPADLVLPRFSLAWLMRFKSAPIFTPCVLDSDGWLDRCD